MRLIQWIEGTEDKKDLDIKLIMGAFKRLIWELLKDLYYGLKVIN